jgi:hypothetical protein
MAAPGITGIAGLGGGTQPSDGLSWGHGSSKYWVLQKNTGEIEKSTVVPHDYPFLGDPNSDPYLETSFSFFQTHDHMCHGQDMSRHGIWIMVIQ